MRHGILPNLFTRRTFVDTDHGHTDRPGGVPDTQSEISIVCGLVVPHLHVVDDFGEVAEYVVFEGLEDSFERGREINALRNCLPCFVTV